jgi:hypothetical protein
MKQVTSRDITPLLGSLGPVLYRRIGLGAWYVVHVPGDAAGPLPCAVHVWDATVLLVVPPSGAQQALSDHTAFVGVVVDLAAPVALRVLTRLRPPPAVSERR